MDETDPEEDPMATATMADLGGVLGKQPLTRGFTAAQIDGLLRIAEPVEFATNGMADVVKSLGHEDALAPDIGRRLRKAGVLETIGRSPGKVGPVSAGFEDVVLKVHLLNQN